MHTSSESLTFRCRPNLGLVFLAVLFFGVAAAFFAWRAHTNEQGLVINGLIHFGPGGASVFFWVLGGVSALFVLAGVLGMFTMLVYGVPDVVVGPDAVTFPRGFPVKRAFTLPYAEIKNLSRGEVNGQHFLTLHTAQKKYGIALNWLESDEARAQFQAELMQRLGRAG